MDTTDAAKLLTSTLWPEYMRQYDRALSVERWLRWEQDTPRAPVGATPEHRYLLELAKTPWLRLVVQQIVQELSMDGFRSPDSESKDNSPAWRTWEGNDFDSRQSALYYAALGFGHSYVISLPGTAPDGSPMSVLRGRSPKRCAAVYQDPAEDDWPMYAVDVMRSSRSSFRVRVIDEENVFPFASNDSGATWQPHGDVEAHDTGLCPVSRYAPDLDLDAQAPGIVEPLIGVGKRINKTVYDRLLAQHFTSWRILTVAGMEQPSTQEEQNRAKLKLRQDTVLVSDDPETKFGVLPAGDLTGFLAAHKDDLSDLAALSQLPISTFNGGVSNVSADALALLRSGLDAFVGGCKKSLGKSHGQTLRVSALQAGDTDTWEDLSARATWQDTSVRSLAQAADALGKFATMLGVPAQALWERIPGVEAADLVEWRKIAAAQPLAGGSPFTDLANRLANAAGGTPPAPPAGV